jgi:hypothetical protein
MDQALVHVGTTEPPITLHLSIRLALFSLVLPLPIDLVNIAVMELYGPVPGPLVSRQLFSERHAPMLATFTEAAHDKLNRVLVRDLGNFFKLPFGGWKSGLVIFWG